ncbi:CocE/NonD family hydrolase [Streptomyces sp. NPDC093111]|uniref:CocE/NonD family hydrolase n=1 Tax=Streptomyces sp. NPDC093111 TaxID=3154978 RepID=UPI003442BF97
MSPNGEQNDAPTPFTANQQAQIASSGIWASGTEVSADVTALTEALVATLSGSAESVLLPPELQELVDQVKAKATIGFPRITADDGVRLSAFSIRLNGDEPRPVVVVPSGWTPLGWTIFAYLYLRLALRGYHVLAYTPRGIGQTFPVPGGGFIDAPFTSQGTVDIAGPNDWADGSTVIDYVQERFAPSRVAFLGESYGSGISQLVAAHDPAGRVDAVVALSTWGDLQAALLGNDTRHLAAVDALVAFTGGPEERKFDEATRQLLADFRAGVNLDDVRAWAAERSPLSYIDQTNARNIPTFYSNTWHETLFPVNGLLAAFERLTVPKHLNLWIGDHAAPEGTGLTVPGPNVPVEEALAWLDHHVLGTNNQVPDWEPVKSQVMFEPTVRESHNDWAELTTSTETLYLGAATAGQDGALGTAPSDGWQVSFTTGELTEAKAVDELLKTGQQEWKGNPKTYVTGKFDRTYLATWTSPAGARRVRGIPRVRLAVTPAGNSATLVAYLFDLAPDGTARIITHEPYTLVSDEPGRSATVSWDLQAASYDVAADHRIMLVVNAKDALYSDANPALATLRVGSTAGVEARLDLPLG